MMNDCKIDGRYTQLCASSTDGATGVKQLSALAALGEKMLLNQEGFSNSSSHKAQGCQRSPWAAMEAICLDVTVQQVSPGWGISKHLTRQKRKKREHHRLNIRNVHHTRSLSQHTRHNKPVFTLIPARVRAALFALSLERGGHPWKNENAEAERGKENGRTNHGHRGWTAPWLFSFECHRVEVFFPPPPHYPRQTPELHLCLECLCTGSCPLTGMFCKGSSPIITVNTLLHTFLLPLVFCANNAAAEACSIEAVMADSYSSWITSTSLPTRPDWMLAKRRLKLIFNWVLE